MKKEGYYSSGAFATLAHVTKKTLRYYDEHGYLKPSYVNENGARFYTDKDFQKLQQILLLKYLGLSLDDIKEMTMKDHEGDSLISTLKIQKGLLDERIEQMRLVREMLQETIEAAELEADIDWTALMDSLATNTLENSLKQQYKNASNISARINLHTLYSQNEQGWFSWVFENMKLKSGKKILELGCGSGSLWIENKKLIPPNVEILLSDSSKGILRDIKNNIGVDGRFKYKVIDFNNIPLDDESVDVVIANHVLFYAEDVHKVLEEIKRVLKPGGKLICTTYGSNHMKEISTLVQEFDDRIVLAAEHLYEIFGKDNGAEILAEHFPKVKWKEYEDKLVVTDSEALADYIISCHGNQNSYIVDRYKEFKQFIDGKMKNGFEITKEAGMFVAKKKKDNSASDDE